MPFLALLIVLALVVPFPGGNLGLICGKPCGGKIPLGPGLIGGPRGPIPRGPIIGCIRGGGPRVLGPKRGSGGGPPGPGLIIEPGLGGGGGIRGRIGPKAGPIGGGGGGILGGIPGIGSRPKRGGGGLMPTGGIRGGISGPLFNGLIFLDTDVNKLLLNYRFTGC